MNAKDRNGFPIHTHRFVNVDHKRLQKVWTVHFYLTVSPSAARHAYMNLMALADRQ
jgi:hypothetical protein